MSQFDQKERPAQTPIVPPPLVSRRDPEPALTKKQSEKAETPGTQNGQAVRKDPRGEPSRPTKEPTKPTEEDPAANEKGQKRDRSRSRDRKNHNQDGRDTRDNRRDRFNGSNNGRAGVKLGRRREFREEPNKQQTYYKTKLCPAYQAVSPSIIQGKCQKEGKCSFAHGQHELRDMPNFKKTKLCIEYLHGKCPYNTR